MSDNDTIFEESTSQDPVEQTEPVATDTTDYVSQYVGEGKKYATLEEALKATDFAQKHIQQIEKENEELRQIKQRENVVEEILAKIEQNKADGNEPSQGIDLSQIDKILDQKLDARSQQKIMTNNIKTVDSQMKALYGNKAKEMMLSKAKQLGISVEQMQDTAAKSPNAFMAWFGKDSSVSPSLSSDKNFQINPEPEVKPGTYNYYRQQMKANPALKTDKKFQNQMMDEALKKGDAFYA